MIPLKRVLDEKRRLVLPVAAGLALNIVLYAAVVYPLGARVRSAERREQGAAAALAAAEREDRDARELVTGKDRTDGALQSFYTDVLPAGLAGARGMTYLHLAQLAERHNLRSSRRSADTETNAQGALERLRLSMALTGDYEDIRAFIHDLESGQAFIVIDSVTLAQSADSDAPLQLLLALSTYYRHGA